MLDDDGPLEIRGDLLEALKRRHRLGAIEVERRHTIRIVILAEVRRGCTEANAKLSFATAR
jgi:hypothetical protein